MEKRTADHFEGFEDAPGAAEAWLRADLLRVLKRRPEQFAVARPVHGLATRLRGTSRDSSDSFASWLVYDWIKADDPNEELLQELKSFVEVEPDDPTSTSRPSLSRCSDRARNETSRNRTSGHRPRTPSASATPPSTATTFAVSSPTAHVMPREPHSSTTSND